MTPAPMSRRFARFALAAIACMSLASCGGGGGGGSGSSSSSSSSGGGSSSSSSGGSVGGSGGFSLSATTATFQALRNTPVPAETRIVFTVTGNNVAAVGAGFAAGVTPPSWLGVNIEGASPNFTLVLSVNSTQGAPGRYTSTLTVGTANSAGTILSTRDVSITFDLVEGMTVGATPRDNSFVFGSSRTTEQITVTVGAPGKSWTITSNQPWLPAPSATQQGDGTLTLTLNGAATGQAPGGTATAQLVVQNTAEPIDRHVLTINAAIVPPRPIVSMTPIALGGLTGLDGISRAVEVSLDTGTNAYPLTVSLESPQSPLWLARNISLPSISSAQHSTVTLSAGPAIGALGDYTATAHFDALVSNQTFRTSVPVTMKWHGQRLVPDQDGVAFSSFPSRPQPTARTMRIRGSRGMDNIPWTATSSQGWLSVTPSGVTGGNLTLTANPAGLATNTVHIAEVTLASSSANIERTERIRVGLWIGATNPTSRSVNLTDFSYGIAVNPVEPYAYALYGGVVHVFNIYSGVEIATWSGFESSSASPDSLTSVETSSDGSRLFVANTPAAKVFAVNAATGQLLATYPSVNRFGSPLDSDLRYVRTNGYPVLLTPFGDLSTFVIDVESGAGVQLSRQGVQLFEGFQALRAASPDGSRFFTIDDASTTDTINEFSLAFGVLGGRTLQVNVANTFFTFNGGFTRQMCVSASGTRLYAHNQGAMQEIALDIQPPHHLRDVPIPAQTSMSAIDCNWNGRIYAGLSTFSAPQNNVFVLNAAGANLGSFQNGPLDSGIIVQQMGLSGDSRRMVSTHVESGTPSPLISLQFFDVPP